MKRIVPVTLGVCGLAAAGLVVGPKFIDWNKYKPQIVAAAKEKAGYDIAIDGDIGLSILPTPHLTLAGLRVAAPRGDEPNLLTMKEAAVSVSLLPLLNSVINIDTVRLVEPQINLEKLADGTNSWMSEKLLTKDQNPENGQVNQGGNSGNDTQAIALNKVTIEGGSVSYVDKISGQKQAIEAIDMTVKADSLNGPFSADGSVSYKGQPIEIKLGTEAFSIDNGKREIPLKVEVKVKDEDAAASFDGVVAIEPSLDVQGKTMVTAENLSKLLTLAGMQENPALAQKLNFSGLVSANEDRVSSDDMDVTFGDASGKGTVAIAGLKERNPVSVKANMMLKGTIDLDKLGTAKARPDDKSVEEKVAKGEALSSPQGLLPAKLTMPFPVDASIQVGAEAVKFQGQTIKGINLDATAKGSAFDVTVKATDLPGKTAAQGSAGLRYSASAPSAAGIVYSNPSLAFKVSGASAQLPSLLRAFASGQASNNALEIWKTGKVDMDGTVTPDAVRISNGALVLDEDNIVFTGSYAPKGAAGRPDASIDVTTNSIDIDRIMARMNGDNRQAVQKDKTKEADVESALKPVRAFDLPVNLAFDLSAQKAVYDGKDINGVRIKGKAGGKALNLEVASAQDFLGAAASVAGSVADLEKLSGIDVRLYGRTGNVRGLMEALKMDASKLPAQIGAAEANVTAKGSAENLAFDAQVQALDGTAEAKGTMTGLLDKPAFNNLSVGASHPNFVRAMQIVNPAFKGGDGLAKPFSFFTNAVKSGDAYDLSELKASLGGTALTGALKVDMGGKVPSVSGTIDAGDIPLDAFLGAKDAGGGSSGAYGASGGSSSGGGKWSRDPIETEWMHSVEADLGLTAQSITYGGWNFQKPQTKITLKGGNLTVSDLKAGLFGGSASLSAKVQDPVDPKQPLGLAIQTKMDKIALDSLVTALSGTQRMDTSGDVSLDLNVQSTGLSAYNLVSGLQGKATLGGQSVVMKGFDLAQIGLAFVDTGKPMDRLNNIVGGAVSGGETRFDTIKGAYDIAQGVATITAMEMDGPAANIKSRGNVNLSQWTIDTVHTITFKQAKEAGAFNVNIKGPLDNPGNTFGRGLFNDILTKRLQQKAVEKLPDVLGKDLSGKLQGLGILPKAEQPAKPASIPDMEPETPAAAPEAAPADGSSGEGDAAPAAEPQAQKSKKEQQIDDAAKAVQGILGSFGR